MQLHDLALEGARRDTFAQTLEAVHRATPAVAAPRLPEASAQPAASTNRFVARLSAWTGTVPDAGVAARRNHRLRPAQGDEVPTAPRVVGAIGADAGNRLLRRNLCQQFWPHQCVANGVAGDLDRPDLQRLRVDAQVDLAPLAPVFGPVLPALALAFAQELDRGAVDQQLQGLRTGPIADLDLQRLLAPTHRAVVLHLPVLPSKSQQVLYQAQCLPQGQLEQALDAQAEHVRERFLTPESAWSVISSANPRPSALRFRSSNLSCGTSSALSLQSTNARGSLRTPCTTTAFSRRRSRSSKPSGQNRSASGLMASQ